jgi:methylenetetrahydrofolate dehydrogenase (NADP+)/methenyltetrahydrofolate cyclohydrolase
VTQTPPTVIFDGREESTRIIAMLNEEVDNLKHEGWQPALVSITVGDAQAVRLYVRNQRRFAKRAGIEFEERHFPATISEAELLAAIATMNVDPRVTGIIVQRPVPAQIAVRTLQEAIHPLKDVEGLHPASIGNIVYEVPQMGPCTAMAAMHILKQTGVNLEGLEVCVVGHSEIVGKPIAFLLMAEGATVTVCHHMTRSVAEHSRRADVVIVAVGKARLISSGMIRQGAIIIDIGINQEVMDDGSDQVVGDVDFVSCKDKASFITPVPGGVGPVTGSLLIKNAVTAAKRQAAQYAAVMGPTNANSKLRPD